MPYRVGDSYEVFERPAIDSRLIDKISRDPRVVIAFIEDKVGL